MSIHSVAQYYPVQATTQLVPPYSVYLSDYATNGNERLRVILLQRDLSQPSYQLRLAMTIELDGRVIMRTSSRFVPPPITLAPGVPTVIAGAEMAPYVESVNIEFIGYDRAQYERTKSLPEGSYRLTFTAYDYRRQDVQVSNTGSSFYFLSKSEPPQINLPACGSKAPARTPLQVTFSWLPRNTSSPNSAGDTDFELSIYETRPDGRNPNDVVLTTQPVFRTITQSTHYIYGPADPPLIDGMKYAWRVRAIDRNGKDAFRNNGYSEACTFTYGGEPFFDLGIVRNLQAEAQTERRARIWWESGKYDGYLVNYKKAGQGHEWFTHQVRAPDAEFKLFDLEPDTEYEIRIQAKKSGYLGDYSDVVKFRTKEHVIMQCGVVSDISPADISRPHRSLIRGMMIEADDIEVQLDNVLHLGDGWYKGTGRTSIDYFGGAVFAVTFERLFVDENRMSGIGRIDFVTQGVAALVHDQVVAMENQQRDAAQQQNQEAWQGTIFYEEIFLYDNIEIEQITVDVSDQITITDKEGNVLFNTDITQILLNTPEKAIIIEDKNGDQYVVQNDAGNSKIKITKVEGGGLMPGSNLAVTDEDKDIIRKVLREIRAEYAALLPDVTQRLATARRDADRVIEENHLDIGAGVPVESIDNTDLVEIDVEFVTGSSVEEEYKKQEMFYNVVRICLLISNEARHDNSYTLIAAGLVINGQSLPDYLAEARAQRVAETEQIIAAKDALIGKIKQVINDYVYEK
jgi:TANFOR domain-containing protein